MPAFGAMAVEVVAGFGAPVLYARLPGPSAAVMGVFDRAYAETLDRDASVDTLRAVLTVALVDFALLGIAPQQNDQVEVALLAGEQASAFPLAPGATLKTFAVRSVQPDGVGGTVLELEQA